MCINYRSQLRACFEAVRCISESVQLPCGCRGIWAGWWPKNGRVNTDYTQTTLLLTVPELHNACTAKHAIKKCFSTSCHWETDVSANSYTVSIRTDRLDTLKP